MKTHITPTLAAALGFTAAVAFFLAAAARPQPEPEPPTPACAALARYVADLGAVREHLMLGGGTRKELGAEQQALAACIDTHGLQRAAP